MLRAGFAALLVPTLSASAHAEPVYQLRADKAGWGEASHADLTKVLRSACDSIARHLGEFTLPEPIRVRHDREGPITLFRRNLRGEIVVQLSSRDLYWAQHSYQMAHEFCHVLCGFREGGRENSWFEEALCELASIYAIRSMAKSWETAPPYSHWKPFAKSLCEYATDIERKFALPEGQTLDKYYSEHAERLRKSPTDRSKNGTIALALLPLLEKNPDSWQALRHLNDGAAKDNLPFRKHLKNWHENCTEKHRPFIRALAKELGIKF